MLKTLGIIFVFSAFVFCGFYFSRKELAVLKSIKRAEQFLYNIILCVQNEHMTVIDIFKTAEKSGDAATKAFLQNIDINHLEDAPKAAETSGFSANKTVTEVLCEVFFVLGRYSAEEQIKEISFCRKKLLQLYEKNKDVSENKAKLCIYIGFFCGISAVVILI